MSEKLSIEYVRNRVESEGCKLLDTEYGGAKSILHIIGICGHEYESNFGSFKFQKIHKCDKCNRADVVSKTKFTYEYVKNFIESMGCELLDDIYLNINAKMDIKMSCGHIIKNSFRSFKESKCLMCSDCAHNKISYEEAKMAIEKYGYILFDGEYNNSKDYLSYEDSFGYKYYAPYIEFRRNIILKNKLLRRYGKHNPYSLDNLRNYLRINDSKYKIPDGEVFVDMATNITIIDNFGYKYIVAPNELMTSIRIGSTLRPYDLSNIYTIENMKHYIQKNNFHFSLCEGQVYKSAWTKLKFECKDCKKGRYFFETRFYCIENGRDCNTCCTQHIDEINNLKVTYPDISLEWDYEKNFPATPENTFPHTLTKYWWKCPDCGCLYLSAVAKRTGENRGCPNCTESTLEKKIRKTLIKYGENFEAQKWFTDCRNIYPLPFDFYIADKNILIEAQGIQHFKVNDFFGGEEAFKIRLNNDRIKKEYCENKGIQLIYINYYEHKDIDNIIRDKINSKRREVELVA
jgi:hypothetical protein